MHDEWEVEWGDAGIGYQREARVACGDLLDRARLVRVAPGGNLGGDCRLFLFFSCLENLKRV